MANFIITNREILENDQIREDGNENAGDNLRFGTYDIDKREFNLFPEPDDENKLRYDTLDQSAVTTLAGSSRFFSEVYQLLTSDQVTTTPDGLEKTDVIFFIHGFNTNLEGVRENIDDLNRRYINNPNSTVKHLIVFTWPGRTLDVPVHYRDDKKDAIRSGEALARGVTKLESFFRLFLVKAGNKPCNRKIHLLVHSMGHRVLKHMLLTLEKEKATSGIPEIFEEIILMAADVEYDVFTEGNAYYNAIDFGQRIHIYFHEKDRVLDISKYTKNFNNRLGRYGRKYKDPGLQFVYDADVSHTNDDEGYNFKYDKLNHWYYYSSSEVVEDVIDVLKGRDSRFYAV